MIVPDSVTEIGYGAWSHDKSLTALTIGSGITSIGANTLYDATSLTSFTIKATTPPTTVSDFLTMSVVNTIYVPAESVEAYKTSWSNYANIIQAIPTT
jgi:hypothetical protein